MSDDRIIKTYVWHGEKCFFVSTIERDSSASEGPRRYNETLIWEYDWEKGERGEMIDQIGDSEGSIRAHQKAVEGLYEAGVSKAMTGE